MDEVYFVLRTAIGLICLWAGLAKIIGFPAFRASIRALGITPSGQSTAIALGIVATELLVSAAMLADVFMTFASISAAALFISFAGGALVAIRRHRSAPCHCFGGADGDVASPTTVFRAIALALSSLGLAVVSMTSPASLSLERAVPSSMIAVVLVLLARYSSMLPMVIGFFRSETPAAAPATRRASFRHRPMESSLRQALPHAAGRSSLSMIEAGLTEEIEHHG